jgi:deoxyhypusine synthase
LKIHNGKSIKWGIDGEETIFTGTQSGSVLDEVSSWFKIDKEGQTTLAAIAKKLK